VGHTLPEAALNVLEAFQAACVFGGIVEQGCDHLVFVPASFSY
jgi:hypothetical protein